MPQTNRPFKSFTMDTLDTLIEPLRQSPRLVEVALRLQEQIESEKELRRKFYEEMTPEQKIEFINGEVILHSPARKEHLDVTGQLFTLLRTFVATRNLGTILSEKCLCVFPRNDYEPDIVFFGLEKSEKLDRKTLKFPIPDFVVEVLSESTEIRDRGVKREDYAAHGVKEYWIIDADSETVERYQLGADAEAGYELVSKSSSGEVECGVIKGFKIPVRAVFDEAVNLGALRELLKK